MLQRIRKLFERRATPRTSPAWLRHALGGLGTTTAGVDVGPDTALTLSAYYAAVRAISEDVAKLPLILYKRLQPRGKRRMSDHPLYSILHDAPNSEMSSMAFRETLTLHAIVWGNGYAEILRDDRGRVRSLWPIDPNRVRVGRNDRNEIEYVLRPAAGGEEVRLPASDVLHIHGLGFDGLTGYSVAHLARESIGAALATERSGAALFGNGSRPGGIIETPTALEDEAYKNLQESWEKAYGGTGNAHKTAILEHGYTYKPLSIPNKDAQWIEAREFQVSEFARWLRIPPHKIGHMRDATFSNIESQAREYVTDTLSSWFVRWEQELQRKVIPRGMFAEHLADGLLRGDTEGRFRAYQTAIQSGWLSRNEVRERENLNPRDGLDELLMPLNTGPASEAGGVGETL